MSDNSLKPRVIRVAFTVLYVFIYAVAEIVTYAITLFQALVYLITGAKLETLDDFATSLSDYIRQIVQFLTMVSDNKPFPFDDFPAIKKTTNEAAEAS